MQRAQAVQIERPRLRQKLALAQLGKDHPVDFRHLRRVRRNHLNRKALGQTLAVEVLLHGKTRAEQSRAAHTLALQRLANRITNMQQRYLHRRLNGRRHLVHGVGGQQQCRGPRLLKPLSGLRQHLPSRLPVATPLQLGDLGKIH